MVRTGKVSRGAEIYDGKYIVELHGEVGVWCSCIQLQSKDADSFLILCTFSECF